MAECNVTIRTKRPYRKVYFTWMIDNVSKFSRKLHSSAFSTDNDCKHKFQVIAKFSEMFPDVHISSVSIGLQRVDSEIEPLNVASKVKLLNIDGDQYFYQKSRWVTWKRDDAPIYVLTELFTDLPDKLKIPEVKTSISSEDDHEMVGLKGKRLLASYRSFKKVFILPGDVLIVSGKIKIFGCCPVKCFVEDPKKEKKLQLQAEQLVNDFRNMYLDGIDTDIQLIVGDQVLNVHKFVLQSRSPVFRSMFEHNTAERNDRAIYITDIEFEILKALMWYFYTGEIQKLTYNEVCDLYEAADKYQISTLQRACSEVLMLLVRIDTVCRIMVLAYLHNDGILKDHALHYVWRNFTEVKMTDEWKMTCQGHQDIALDVLRRTSMFPFGAIPLKAGGIDH
ncbi:TD and POZ domain-containing protein 2-like [Argiope bruennichi]|uniref:TD and POZ domain-containing protein 2-like n=1 Tax=Argiope bruennichi TaxID=94029 RepID=UPI0024956665|nr:TD and POZ domain-containing protein 2-like [Argiope bruennichi]